MNTEDLQQLILYIVSQVNDLGGYVTKIRLVKFVYLIDIEYRRRIGTSLTGLKWLFYKYGPYAFELPNITKDVGYDLEEEEFESGSKKGVVFHVKDSVELPATVPQVAKNIIDRVLSVWALETTADILNYTYFETEPMLYAKRGDPLDFNTIARDARPFELSIEIPKKQAKKIKESLAQIEAEEKSEHVSFSAPHDQIYFENIDLLE